MLFLGNKIMSKVCMKDQRYRVSRLAIFIIKNQITTSKIKIVITINKNSKNVTAVKETLQSGLVNSSQEIKVSIF